jgi:hypothetical protein
VSASLQHEAPAPHSAVSAEAEPGRMILASRAGALPAPLSEAPPIANKSASPRTKLLFLLLLTVGMPAVAFVAIEGGSSLLLFARDALAATSRATPQQLHTEHDPELGWISRASFDSPDFYGPGLGIRTNSRRFRGAREVADSASSAVPRVICSGDSFTFGFGVADDDSWCHLLGTHGLETVNMAQVGYGVDQAYLWYMRDGRRLQHDVHVLAVITDDFERMADARFLGYAKPKLVVRDDTLVVTGVPTAPPPERRATPRLRQVLQSLRVVQLVSRLRSADNAAPAAPAAARRDTQEIRDVVARLVARLQQVNIAKESRLLLVYLPIERDFVNDAARPWRAHMRHIADSLSVPLLDLVPPLRALPADQVPALYQQQSGAIFEGMGHYTARGNRWVADQVAAALDSLRLLPPPVRR